MDRKMGRRGLALAVLLAVAGLGSAPLPAVACSCMMPEPLSAETFDRTAHAVLIGTVAVDDPRGVRVNVERWFAGDGRAPIVWLDPGNFDPAQRGGGCGIERPPDGTIWVVAAYQAGDGLLGINLCSRQALLASPEGQALVGEARAAFGEGVPLGPGAPPMPVGAGLVAAIVGALLSLLRLIFGR